MKTYQFADRTIVAGEASQLEQLIAAVAADTPATIIDLRTFLEAGEDSTPRTPEGWGYRRLPITGSTVSEQDIDVLRREFFRKPQSVVIGPNSSRASLLITASLSRHEQKGWENAKDVEVDSNHGESHLQEWLDAYLARHGVGA